MHPEILSTIHRALAEDIGDGDVTTNACVPAESKAVGYFVATEWMILAGTGGLNPIYESRGTVTLELLRGNCAHLNEGDRIANVQGSARTLSYTHLTLPTIYSV